MAVTAYSDLEVWREAMSLAEEAYRVTASIDTHERFGLVDQMRRAAVSIVSNVAEGHSRRSDGALLYHLSVALGSVAELETQAELCCRLGFVGRPDADNLSSRAAKVGRMLSGFVRHVKGEVARRHP